jgi:hypothetical protein
MTLLVASSRRYFHGGSTFPIERQRMVQYDLTRHPTAPLALLAAFSYLHSASLHSLTAPEIRKGFLQRGSHPLLGLTSHRHIQQVDLNSHRCNLYSPVLCMMLGDCYILHNKGKGRKRKTNPPPWQLLTTTATLQEKRRSKGMIVTRASVSFLFLFCSKPSQPCLFVERSSPEETTACVPPGTARRFGLAR